MGLYYDSSNKEPLEGRMGAGEERAREGFGGAERLQEARKQLWPRTRGGETLGSWLRAGASLGAGSESPGVPGAVGRPHLWREGTDFH